ncbi:putative adenosine monophosphate-protein transferase Fic [Acinetobacter indicus]|uniref:putative adenosine monophosphate-protein transferase Fic n=1 Tax=Acinetobacter indicus TaxID=756892 RepID=UPI00257506AA|nr:putative adenosine monophosphate-protein transferase Fic [Acinetobacter indicus]MDM1769973.1 putative adenosine monophosphate-protein transferase Fic [Acinetobacter indicus]MDM1773025.1 putative adenosine monophosphate-protein transferase Fic [Acinetobacter indicus]
MDKYGEVGDSIYCYPNSDILKNKLNIQDAAILQQAELELSETASIHIEFAEPPYDLKYLQSIHRQLFSDLYEWAGELRQADIAKGNTRFCTFPRIEIEANKLFKQLEQQNYFQGLEKSVLIQKVADFYCELNVIHPFREGNGRTQRIFFEHLLAHCGYGVQWNNIENKEVWIQANIEGFNCHLDRLIDVFTACIITPES